MKNIAKYCQLGLFTLMVVSAAAVADETATPKAEASADVGCASWLNHKIGQLHSSKEIDLCQATQGKTVLIVNTASHCGYTKQFGGLEALYQSYKDKGLVIIGFPSNSFNQEADDTAETANVCYKNFGVTFLMTDKVSVKGEDSHPIFKHLAQSTEAPGWNFTKYLVNQQGQVIHRFASRVKPDDQQLIKSLDRLM